MSQIYRLSTGGLINRNQTIEFTFDGKKIKGYQGDTLASALLANGIHLVGRSFKYHRPRGIFSASSQEPNALVQLRQNNRHEPNTRATTVELYSGLNASSQNRWPSLKHDIMGVNNLLSPFLGAGFYYKTFMWPKSFWESVYEPVIRRAAGLGKPTVAPDPDQYERLTHYCDILIVGAGPAGLMAALNAAKTGARVAIVDENPNFGGQLLQETTTLDNIAGHQWASQLHETLSQYPNITCLPRTTAVAYYDDNTIACVERANDHVAEPPEHQPRQRLWRMVTKKVILACGALERSLVFNGNDRPGVMLASAVRAYTNQFAVHLGNDICIFTNNDSAYQTAIDLSKAGSNVQAIIDSRQNVHEDLIQYAKDHNIRHFEGANISQTKGKHRISHIQVRTANDQSVTLACDILACSGGWNPNIQLHSHTTAIGCFDDEKLCFIPGDSVQDEVSIGGAAGVFDLQKAMTDAHTAAIDTAKACGFSTSIDNTDPLPVIDRTTDFAIEALWRTPNATSKAFVDMQNDVTVKDITLAVKEGFVSVEHLKRYTTLGMATDQGKNSNVNALAILAQEREKPIAQVGTTRFRPPAVPVAMGVFAGSAVGQHMAPIRKTSTHTWALNHNAVFTEAGQWLRPHYYARKGEGLSAASYREAIAVRESVGICDVSTLGKIDIQGQDALELLSRIYSNNFATLKVGKARYGLMLREDGMLMDDGTTSCLAENHYFMTTTTANAARIMAHLEFHLQVTWPELDVQIASVTEQWAGFAIAGPKARTVLQRFLSDDLDISHEAFPFLGAKTFQLSTGDNALQKIRARLFRISFSGELAYEIYVPAHYGESTWENLIAHGEQDGITPYGTEALSILRIEKGHVAGPELSGNTTAADIGLGKMAGDKKDYIGRFLKQRAALQDDDREVLVGITSNTDSPLWEGAHVVDTHAEATMENDIGYLTSVTWSPNLQQWVALALVRKGRERIGDTVRVVNPLLDKETEATLVSPHFYDPDNEKLFL